MANVGLLRLSLLATVLIAGLSSPVAAERNLRTIRVGELHCAGIGSPIRSTEDIRSPLDRIRLQFNSAKDIPLIDNGIVQSQIDDGRVAVHIEEFPDFTISFERGYCENCIVEVRLGQKLIDVLRLDAPTAMCYRVRIIEDRTEPNNVITIRAPEYSVQSSSYDISVERNMQDNHEPNGSATGLDVGLYRHNMKASYRYLFGSDGIEYLIAEYRTIQN